MGLFFKKLNNLLIRILSVFALYNGVGVPMYVLKYPKTTMLFARLVFITEVTILIKDICGLH